MKEIIYNITQQTEGRKVAITGVNEPVNKSNVLGIINKTQSKVLYTPLQYANLISSEWSSLDGGTLTLTLADNVQIINVGDKLFVKLYLDKDIDFSALAKEETLTQVASKVKEVGNKIDSIKLPEINTTELAKQGKNQDATLTVIYGLMQQLPSSIINRLKNEYTYPVNYDGAEVESDTIKIQSILGAILYKDNIVSLTDDYISELTVGLSSLGFKKLTKLTLNKIISLDGAYFMTLNLTYLSLPSFSSAGSWAFRGLSELRQLYIPNTTFTGHSNGGAYWNSPKLIDIICGAKFNQSQYGFSGEQYGWIPTEAMRDDVNTLVTDSKDEFGNVIDNNRKQLLYNLRRHMAANLPQLTTEGYTIAFNSQMREIITADTATLNAFIDKGWTIS